MVCEPVIFFVYLTIYLVCELNACEPGLNHFVNPFTVIHLCDFFFKSDVYARVF
jgi:hypothetical protein